MQAAIDAGHELADIAGTAKELVRLTIPAGITNHQYGPVVYILSRCWVHGLALDDWVITEHQHSFRASYVEELLGTHVRMQFVDDEAYRAFLRRRHEDGVARAEKWARLMELMMMDGRTLEEVARPALRDVARLDFKTPPKPYWEAYMIGFLVGVWVHGCQLGEYMLSGEVA